MRHHLLLMTAACLTACAPQYTTVDEACVDKVGGAKRVSQQGDVDTLARINCYRKAARANKGSFDRLLQRALEGHGKYLSLNTAPTLEFPVNFMAQDLSKPAYTGATQKDRWDSVGFFPPGGTGQATLFLWDIFDEEDRVEFWMANPWMRHDFLSPQWFGAAFFNGTPIGEPSEGQTLVPGRRFLIAEWFFVAERGVASRPVVWPPDGMTEVSTTYLPVEAPLPSEVELCHRYGPAISVSVGAGETNLRFEQFTLEDSNGDTVPFILVPESSSTSMTPNVLVVLPESPLLPNADYRVVARVSTAEGTRKIDNVFTTGAGHLRTNIDEIEALCR